MTEPYNEWRYLWPTRVEAIKLVEELPIFENVMGWWTQVKREGTRSPVWVHPDKSISSMGRHNNEHKTNWVPGDDCVGPLRSLGGKGFHSFDCELMHSKVKDLRDTLYVFDVYVHDGELLTGMTLERRLKLLDDIFPGGTIRDYDRAITPNFWVARTFRPGTNYVKLFNGLTHAMDEGLVVKDPASKLKPLSREGNNTGWQAKVRRPKKLRGI